FWIACIPAVKLERICIDPILTNAGWTGVSKATPFAILGLVIIELRGLSAAEAHEPHRTIPRGLLLAQITLIVLVVLTWFFAAAAGSDYKKTGDVANVYPLPLVYQEVWPGSAHLLAFAVV